jgi:hypothetical protein
MSVDARAIGQEKAFGLGLVPVWLWLGIGVYAVMLACGDRLLNDSDTYWQISVGQWIIDHATLPRTDIYSFTKTGEPWTSSSWLAQVLLAGSYDVAGWTGPVVLASASIASAFALLAWILGRRIPAPYAIMVTLAAVVLSTPHLLARPHVLVLPVMLAWAYGLMSASERGEAPSFWLLPLMALWTNLHGGFIFGLVLAGAFAIDALWNADASRRKPLALRWAVFGGCALAACCATPYGWGSIRASLKILDLGELLHVIYEWMPADFTSPGAFEMSILVLIAAALYSGVKLSPPRIALVLGLLHMALSHSRNLEIFALLLPLVALAPVAAQFALQPARFARTTAPLASAALLAVMLGASTWALAAKSAFSPPEVQSPAAAVEALQALHPKRVLNDVTFGGYMIWRKMPVFIDGRAELYGEALEMAYYRALELKDVNQFLDILKTWDIDAVLLTPSTPAVGLLDNIAGWQRVYSDRNAVLHVRSAH